MHAVVALRLRPSSAPRHRGQVQGKGPYAGFVTHPAMGSACTLFTLLALAAAAWYATVAHVKVCHVWHTVALHPWVAPQCSATTMRVRGRWLRRGLLSPAQCALLNAAVDNASVPLQQVETNAKVWQDELRASFSRLHMGHFAGLRSEVQDGVVETVRGVLDALRGMAQDDGNMQVQQLEFTRRVPEPDRVVPWGGVLAAGFEAGSERLTQAAHTLHADNCSLNHWFHAPLAGYKPTCNHSMPHGSFCCTDRMYTAGVYLNPPHELASGALQGGDFLFWDATDVDLLRGRLGFCRVQPICGTAVLFPSDHHHVHATTPLAAGVRRALMLWFTNTDPLPADGLSLDEPAGPAPWGEATPVSGRLHPVHGVLAPGWSVDSDGQLLPPHEPETQAPAEAEEGSETHGAG